MRSSWWKLGQNSFEMQFETKLPKKVRHTCVIPSVGVPTQSGKSREIWSAQDLAEAKAACSKLKGEFSKQKGVL